MTNTSGMQCLLYTTIITNVKEVIFYGAFVSLSACLSVFAIITPK